MSGSKAFFDTIKNRRTIYAIANESPIPDSQIQEIVTEAIRHVPSSFNSQSARAVLVLNKEHGKLWDTIIDIYEKILPADQFKQYKPKFDGFRGGYGTVLWYEDRSVVKGLQEKMPNYADKFPQWSEHTSAMHQFVVWTALEAEGFGANLQHFNPPIDAKLAETYGLPGTWSLKSQLVFGKRIGGPAREKTFEPIEDRLKVFGAS